MKKIIVLLIVVLILTGLMVGCSGFIGPDGVHHKDGYVDWNGDARDKDGNLLYPEEPTLIETDPIEDFPHEDIFYTRKAD